MRISYPKTDPLLSSSMRQASFKCEMPRLELKSSRSFLTPFPLFLVLTYCRAASRQWLERHSIERIRVKIRVMKDAHTRIFFSSTIVYRTTLEREKKEKGECKIICSDTGTRTPVSCVRGKCDDHLHYIGTDAWSNLLLLKKHHLKQQAHWSCYEQ